MTIPLILTKLHIPPVRTKQVRRSRLFEMLNTGINGNLILVSAPAGYGKTTLVSSWVKFSDIPCAWFSVDNDDNDPARFWSYFTTALQTYAVETSASWLPILRSALFPSIETLVFDLLNEIEDKGNRFVLILDDFHLIENNQILDDLLFLVEHLSPAMCLVLSTRSDPPWPMARLRSQGKITEIRIDELRFTPGETSELINSSMGEVLSPEDMIALEARTEGWATGVQLAVLSLLDQPDKSTMIRNFTGSNRYVLDYLAEEVLDRQPPEIDDFLLKTSILDRMSSELCDVILERNDSQVILSQLETKNLFLVPLDDERRWYRYHHLFAELLQSRLHHRYPEEINNLSHRASAWFAGQNLLSEAVSFAVRADDLEGAASLIETSAFSLINQGQLSTIAAWINSLPECVKQTRPWLSVALGWTSAYSGSLDRAESACQEAENALSKLETSANGPVTPADGKRVSGHIAAIRGYCALVLSGNLPRAEELTRLALSLLPEDDLETREFATIIHSISIGARGDIKYGEQVLLEPAYGESATRNIFLKVFALGELAILYIVKGQLHQAVSACQKAFQLTDRYARQSAHVIPFVGLAHCHMCTVLREWNRLEESLRHGKKAMEIAVQWGQKDSLITIYPRLALTLFALGERDQAFETIDRGMEAVRDFSGRLKNLVISVKARLHLLDGNVDKASTCMADIGLNATDVFSFERAHEYRPYVKLLIAQGQQEDALTLLNHLLPIEEATGAINGLIEGRVLQAIALFENSNERQALTVLVSALDLAQPGGYIRTFIDSGETIGKLLQSLPPSCKERNYVKMILAAYYTERTRPGSASPWQGFSTEGNFKYPGFTSGLTRREMVVLQELATSASVEDIANKLCVSISTLRTHIRNIYDKLGVHSRWEAATLARELKYHQ